MRSEGPNASWSRCESMRKRVPRVKELRTREDKSLGLDETYQDGRNLTHFTYSFGVKTQWKFETAGSAEIQVKTKREREKVGGMEAIGLPFLLQLCLTITQ